MVSLTRFQCNFIANWRFGVLTALICLFFLQLGVWQLKRAHEKEDMLIAEHRLLLQAPMDWPARGIKDPMQYQRLHVLGTFLKVTLLLDNQHYQHQLGYNVLSPLLLTNGTVALIDRGWVPGKLSREELPSVAIPKGTLDIVGSAYYPSSKSWSLGTFFDRKQANTAVIELFDAHIISQFLHKPVYPFIIRMRDDDPNSFVREWSLVSMPPARHIAYAVQWFAMALVSVILFVVLTIKKKT